MFTLGAYIIFCGSLVALASGASDGVTGEASQVEFPWHAILYKKQSESQRWEHICSGVLIHPKFVLSGANCASTVQPAELRIKLGQVAKDYYSNTSSSVLAEVKDVKIPEGFVGITRSYALDIALLELTEEVPLSDNVKPVGVDWQGKAKIEDGSKFTLPMWKTNGEDMSPVLHWVKMEHLKLRECLSELRSKNSFLTNDKACFVSVNDTKIDPGNSGGGVVLTAEGGQQYVVALTSVKMDGHKRTIYLMTNITNPEHRIWLQAELKHLEPSTVGFQSSGLPKTLPSSDHPNPVVSL